MPETFDVEPIAGAPFMPGVAYMPVPRCDQCRFWVPASGDCRLFSDDPNIAEHDKWPAMDLPQPKAEVAPFAGADGGALITDADFGCVQWERIP